MQIRQRIKGKNVIIDAVTMSVIADGRALMKEHAGRILDEAKKTKNGPLLKMIDIFKRKPNAKD